MHVKDYIFDRNKVCLVYLILSFALGEVVAQVEQTNPGSVQKIAGAHRQKLFFERLHSPLIFPGPDYYIGIANEISKIPEIEMHNKSQAAVNKWNYFGADGVKINLGNSKLSGRITHMELNSTNNDHLRVMAASGGLWRYDPGNIPKPVSMSDQVSSLWGGAFATDPNDSMVVFLGTGEPAQHGGTGLFKTTDNGVNWIPVQMSPTPSTFYRILFTPGNTQIIHAATAEGYYRSNDGGATWTRLFFFSNGNCSDLVINTQNTNILYLAYWSHGVYKSTDGGDTWTLQTGLPVTNVGRTALAIGTINPDVVYVCMTNDNNNNTKGIYKTSNGGLSWVTCNYGLDLNGDPGTGLFHGNQGWYNNVISVCPINDNIVLAGGVGMWRTTNGLTFTEIDVRHADQHAVVWNPNGTDVLVGNDGGVFLSSNAGFSFNTIFVSRYNELPVSQYYHFSIGKSNARVVAGTTQDNGFHYKSYATGGLWNCKGGGDGSGVQVDPLDSNIIIYGNGIFGDALQSHRYISFDGGANFLGFDDGVDTCGDWFPEMRISPVMNFYYTACEKKVYSASNSTLTWSLLNPSNPFIGDVWDFTVSNDAINDPTVYACLQSGTFVKLMVYDGTTLSWFNRSAGLPTNTYIRKVAVDLLDANIAYALAGGIPSNGAGNKVFKTTDRGQTWTNISGNLPNVAVTDLIPYPGNPALLYLGSEAGPFRTVDGGITWSAWNNGMPPGALINEFDYVDSLGFNGTFYIAACTYGRGIWIREVSGDDPAGIKNFNNQYLFLAQNTDNPGNGITNIIYANSYSGNVKLTLSDITGKTIHILENRFMPGGKYEQKFDRKLLKAGVYFYTLTCGVNSITRKMVVTH